MRRNPIKYFSPLRDERIRTNRAQFEAPPPTETAAAKATRPRLSRERWPGRSHAPRTRAHIESCPGGNYSDLPQRRCPARTPHTGRPRELSVVRVRKPLRHLTNSQLCSFGRRVSTRRRQKPELRGSHCLCAERREKAKRAGRLSAADCASLLILPAGLLTREII